jgi:hypothetical protein
MLASHEACLFLLSTSGSGSSKQGNFRRPRVPMDRMVRVATSGDGNGETTHLRFPHDSPGRRDAIGWLDREATRTASFFVVAGQLPAVGVPVLLLGRKGLSLVNGESTASLELVSLDFFFVKNEQDLLPQQQQFL